MSRDNDQSGAKIHGKLASYITWLTAILVGVPTLINAGIDVYNSVLNIPTGNVERINRDRRSAHFQEEPIFSKDFEIPTGNSKKFLKLFVYQNADIYVNYSGFEQWLPAENLDNSTVSMSFLSTAFAAGRYKEFGSPKATVSPSAIDKKFDLKSLESERKRKSQKFSRKIVRSYWFEEKNNDHSGFFTSKRIYKEKFRAVKGYKITSFKLNIASLNRAKIISRELSADGSHVTVRFSIKSGPMYNRWRGWIKAQVITEQTKK